MVKSPVEGHSIVILKLDKPTVFSDFARPVCLPSTDTWMMENQSRCLTLGWDTDQGQLKVIIIIIAQLGLRTKAMDLS